MMLAKYIILLLLGLWRNYLFYRKNEQVIVNLDEYDLSKFLSKARIIVWRTTNTVKDVFSKVGLAIHFINPFLAFAFFLYPLKISENLWVCWCFQGVYKDTSGMKWVYEKLIFPGDDKYFAYFLKFGILGFSL